ncbi:MAG: hypothetical protein ABI564_17385 [Ideonella sp.]
MSDFLQFDVLDDEAFPELKIPVGRKGISAQVLKPPGDRRVPNSQRSATLLVVFRLDEPGPPKDPAAALPNWHMTYTVTDSKGASPVRQIELLPKPPPGDNLEYAKPDPNMPHVPGLIYRGALWVDIEALYRQKIFKPGMIIEVGFDKQATTRTTLP